MFFKEKERYDPVLWQTQLYQKKIQKAKLPHENANKIFDYTTIADRRFIEIPTFNIPTCRKSCAIKRTHI